MHSNIDTFTVGEFQSWEGYTKKTRGRDTKAIVAPFARASRWPVGTGLRVPYASTARVGPVAAIAGSRVQSPGRILCASIKSYALERARVLLVRVHVDEISFVVRGAVRRTVFDAPGKVQRRSIDVSPYCFFIEARISRFEETVLARFSPRSIVATDKFNIISRFAAIVITEKVMDD